MQSLLYVELSRLSKEALVQRCINMETEIISLLDEMDYLAQEIQNLTDELELERRGWE